MDYAALDLLSAQENNSNTMTLSHRIIFPEKVKILDNYEKIEPTWCGFTIRDKNQHKYRAPITNRRYEDS